MPSRRPAGEAQVEAQVKSVSRRVQSASERALEFVKERPGTSLVGAFAIGYVLARIARRS